MIDFVFALMTAIHPQAPKTGNARDVARAIAHVAAHDEPFPGMSRERTAALLTVMAWHESRLSMSAVGDQGRAFCAMQIHGAPHLANDPVGCVRAGLKRMRESAAVCPEAPLAPYAGGCSFEIARTISRARIAKAERIERAAREALTSR